MIVRSHVAVGLASWVAAAPLLHQPRFAPGCLCLAVLGALLPDIDHPSSWIGRRTRPLSSAIASLLGHRGVTHSALAVIGLIVVLGHFGNRSADIDAIAVGYLSHLAADLLTPAGLRLAWPLRMTWSLPLCRTGSVMESMVVLLFVGGVAWSALHGAPWVRHWLG